MRKIKTCAMTMTKTRRVELDGDVRAWLVENAPDSVDTLLAFALDGLIWGKLANGKLTVAHDVEQEFSTELDANMLQEARLFGKMAELHLWRCNNGWHYQIIRDNEEENGRQYIEEQQILWGDHAKPIDNSGFTLMSDGVQGLHHTVPCDLSGDFEKRPLRLTIRHYLAEEPFARIEFSRLVKLESVL